MIKVIELGEEFQNHYTQYSSSYMLTSTEMGGAGLKPTEYMVWNAYWIEYRNRRSSEYVYCFQANYQYIATKIGMSYSSVKTASQSLQSKGLLFQFKIMNEDSYWVPVDPSDRAYYKKTIKAIEGALNVRRMKKEKISRKEINAYRKSLRAVPKVEAVVDVVDVPHIVENKEDILRESEEQQTKDNDDNKLNELYVKYNLNEEILMTLTSSELFTLIKDNDDRMPLLRKRF